MSWERLQSEAGRIGRRRPADDLLQAILDETAAAGLAVPSVHVGRLLEILAAERGIRRVLEVRTGLGFSTLCLARGALEAELVSLDADEGHSERVVDFLERGGVADRVRLACGDPLELVEGLSGRFDLIHLGAPSPGPRRLVDRLLPQLEVGGLLTVEGVAPDGEASDQKGASAPPFAAYLVMHPQLDCCVLPVGRGLAVARKKRPVVTELGGPF